jgi:hypothetical protein
MYRRGQQLALGIEISGQDTGARCGYHGRCGRTQRPRSIVKHAAIRCAAFKPFEMELPISLLGAETLQPIVDHRAVLGMSAFPNGAEPRPGNVCESDHLR